MYSVSLNTDHYVDLAILRRLDTNNFQDFEDELIYQDMEKSDLNDHRELNTEESIQVSIIEEMSLRNEKFAVVCRFFSGVKKWFAICTKIDRPEGVRSFKFEGTKLYFFDISREDVKVFKKHQAKFKTLKRNDYISVFSHNNFDRILDKEGVKF